MTWEVTDPRTVAGLEHESHVIAVDVPAFPDYVDYEGILASRIADDATRRKLIVLCTRAQLSGLRQLAESSAHLPVDSVRRALEQMAVQRQIAVLRWRD